MKFSERHELMVEAEEYCKDNGVKPTPFNIVSALDILGCLIYPAAQQNMERTVETCAECGRPASDHGKIGVRHVFTLANH